MQHTSFAGKVILLAVVVLTVSALISPSPAWARHGAPRREPHHHRRATIPWALPYAPPRFRVPWIVRRPAPAPAPAPVPAPAPAPTPDPTSLEDEALALTNAHRAQGATCGDRNFPPVPPLIMDPALREVARAHSADMGERRYFDHGTPEGVSPADRMKAAGFTGGVTGENIYGGPSTAAAVVDGWMQSPGHCANIMGAGYRIIGIGHAAVDGSPFVHYWTQDSGG